ncbi:hypothetical protein C3I27_03980 [Campylobacter jejuni]|uniref:Uncharacterized protein n=1 Tax=Campylobacter jejuni TaxID=197 RepID=A0AAX1Z534_CAMJU|nr:hypothetical protein [Campylobacter jejuni]RTI48587.1 hypothetical protein C3I27_03980 [Campylobacter jejuni]
MEKFIDTVRAVDPDGVISGIVVGLFLAFIVITTVNLARYLGDKLAWNNGICKACGEPWEYVELTDYYDDDLKNKIVQLYDCCSGHKLYISPNFKGTKLRIKSFKVENFHNPVFKDFLLEHDIEIKIMKGSALHIDEGLAHPEETTADTYIIYKNGNETAAITGHTYRVSSLTGTRSLLRRRSEIDIRYDLKELLDNGTFKRFKE